MSFLRINNLFNQKKKHRVFDGKLVYGLEKNKIDCFIDIGANYGQTALEIMKWGYKNEIISIEPVKECHDKLIENSKKYPNWKVLERMAIGDFDGQTDINVSEATDLSSIMEPTDLLTNSYTKVKKKHSESVPIKKLDTVFKNFETNKNIFLKIDAQGYDYKILSHSKEFVNRVKGIMVEASLKPLYKNQESYLSYINYLNNLGMKPHMITERSFSRINKQQLQIDLVYFK